VWQHRFGWERADLDSFGLERLSLPGDSFSLEPDHGGLDIGQHHNIEKPASDGELGQRLSITH
jgi:hypothetical protein